ncbi:MAG: mechanosensitive ion channel family protein [Campylobacterota bacterium]|nr:mechanosensitive ion channel family protein [Campylobacterota bacterium]
MKKIILFLLLFSASFLLANDSGNTFDDFIDKQIKVEAKFFDQNLSLDDKVKIKKKQGGDYQNFFLQYATDKKKNLKQNNPYRDEMNRLQIRMNSNKYEGNTNAAMRDDLLLKGYSMRNSIRNTLNDILLQTDSNSKTFFKDKVNEIIEEFFSTYNPLDKSKYLSADQNLSSPIVQSLHSAIQNLSYLENVASTFSSELVENSSLIYRTARISDSKFLFFVNQINSSPFGQKLNTYLSSLNLDSAKLILVLSMIVFTIVLQYIINFLINYYLHHHNLKDEDIKYIHTHIIKIFTIITSLIVIHFTLVVFLGFDSQSINISKLFAVLYVILISLLLYRITDTVAYLKIERMKKSKVLRNEVINLTIKVIHGAIIIVAIIAILKIAGVNLTALLSGLGIAGAAVAFAAKDSIANVFGSISILLGDVFEQGDWIETKDVNGTVVEIGLRATTIRTFDNALISIPNFNLSDTAVTNWSRRSIGRRIKMSVGVTYESDFGDIKKAIDDIREMLKNNPDIAQKTTSGYSAGRRARLVSTEDYKGVKNTTLVYMDEFADSSINILIYCFSRTVDWAEWLRVKEDVMYKIEDILTRNNLEFAYPTMMLHQASQVEETGEIKKS